MKTKKKKKKKKRNHKRKRKKKRRKTKKTKDEEKTTSNTYSVFGRFRQTSSRNPKDAFELLMFKGFLFTIILPFPYDRHTLIVC